ncbi:hypothetical protein GCM10027612_14600 [Microbispora bryophytorum subsp. camponoti]
MTINRTVAAVLALLLAAACTAPPPPRSQASTAGATACSHPQGRLGAEKATTIDVIEQAYLCILGNYYGGPTLDARSLLTAGFLALTQEINRGGRDVPEAIMPALTGDRKADWAAFEAAYRKIIDRVPDLRDELAVVTLAGIVAAIGDNHARWTHDVERPLDYYDGDGYGLGLEANVNGSQVDGSTPASPSRRCSSPPSRVARHEPPGCVPATSSSRSTGRRPSSTARSPLRSPPYIRNTRSRGRSSCGFGGRPLAAAGRSRSSPASTREIRPPCGW